MALVNNAVRAIAFLSVVPLAGLVNANRAAGGGSGSQVVRQPDAPGFGAIPVAGNQTLRMNVLCFAHQVGRLPPGPCRGAIMFHDAAGHIVSQGPYALKPGQAARFEYVSAPTATTSAARIMIIPCIIPSTGGRAIPTVEVIDNFTGRVALHVNPASPRMSEFNNSDDPPSPGSLVGFNPQPDPPGFGIVSLLPGQTIRVHVSCAAHGVGTAPPDPCRGTVMFHDGDGTLLRAATYGLKPGESAELEHTTPPDPIRTGGSWISIVPCVLPAQGGRAVPNVEVLSNGLTSLLINPAAARMSQFQ